MLEDRLSASPAADNSPAAATQLDFTPSPTGSTDSTRGLRPERIVPGRPLNAAAWDAPLLRAEHASLLQSWRWGEFKRPAGWVPWRLMLYARGGNGAPNRPLVAAQVLFRALPHLPLPVSIAYIPRGPVFFSEEDGPARDAFWGAVHAECRRRGAIFLKVEPDIHLSERLTKAEVDRRMSVLGFEPAGRLQPARTIVLDLAGGEELLLKEMKAKTRYNLRLAGKRGVQVRRAETLDDLRAFYSLLEVTGARDEFGIHTFDYYEELWETLGPGGDNTAVVLLADHPDEAARSEGPIAGLLALRFGKWATYMYGASDNRGREHMPNYLLQWEAIRWAIGAGCTVYDFWGIPDPPSDDEDAGEVSAINSRSGLRGVYWFKKGFGGREIDYAGAYDFVYNPFLYRAWMRWRGANLG